MLKPEHCIIPKKLSGIIFDCDGVIINSREPNALFYNKLLQALDLPTMTKEQEAITHMSTVHQAINLIIPQHLHSKVAEVCKEQVNYQRDIMPLIPLEDGFKDFLKSAYEKGLLLAVHTNRITDVEGILRRYGIEEYFNPVMSAANAKAKPDPEGSLIILEKWQIPATEVLFIGDSLNDQLTTVAAKIPFVAYQNKPLEAAINVESYEELKSILSDNNLW